MQVALARWPKLEPSPDPDQGAITLDGTDLRKFRLTELHRQISVMLQDFAQYQRAHGPAEYMARQYR